MSISRWLSCFFVLLIASPGFVAAQEKPKLLDETLRQLEKDITAVRGLEFKSPVNAKVIVRPKDAGKSVQGYYSTKDKTLYLYDDITGSYERGVLVHEMVHALQDQHFGLAKLHQDSFGSDAELALAVLIEGDATFTMIELLKKDQPKVAAMLDTNLFKAKNLRNAFLYGIGAKYVKGIKDKGGWAAVDARYKFPPRTTASILNPGGTTIDLGPGRSIGAFGLIEMFGGNPDTRAMMIETVAGWLGDRIVEDGAVKSWQVAFDTAEQAKRFQAAYKSQRSASAKDLPAPSGQEIWRGDDGKVYGSVLHGSRVATVEAPSEAACRAAVDRLEGPPKLAIWSAKERRTLSFGELTDRLLDADLICVGESHDSELCHRVQLQIIKAIHARDERLGVGMEMFQRPYQPFLDRYVAGEITEDAMLLGTEYRKRWGFHWSLYQPIAEFCKKTGLPLAALNLSTELRGKISKAGIAKLSDNDKKELGPVDLHVKAHRDHFYELLGKMHGNTKSTEEQKERGYQVMTSWDEYMAASAAGFQTRRHLRRLIVLAGKGHIDHGFGIPQRTTQRTAGKAATVHVAAGGDSEKLFASPPADYVVVVR
jgi:uncharacterized iron-regulated protein